MGTVSSVVYSPDGAAIITASGGDRTIRIWDVSARTEEAQLAGHTGTVHLLAYSPDGTAIATGGQDHAVRIWDAATGTQTAKIGHARQASAIAYSPDGTSLATGDDSSTVHIWDTGTWQERQTLVTEHNTRVRALVYSPDGGIIATAGHDRAVQLWDAGTGQSAKQLTGGGGNLNPIAFSPDGTIIAASSAEWGQHAGHSIQLWDAASGQPIGKLAGHTRRTNAVAVAFSPDGTTIATDDGEAARIWSIETRRPAAELTGHTSDVSSIVYSGDGTTVVTAGRDGTVRLWETGSWQQRSVLTGHVGTVNAVACSPDGRTLVSVGEDHTIRIWNPRTGEQVYGTGFRAAQVPARALAGVWSDSPSTADLLGIGDDVETLAELIAASETQPPLAIALIGDWGAGKSSAMLQIEREITALAERARSAPGMSAFSANIRQVRFNAWHYNDDYLWVGLVRRLFEVLATSAGPDDGGLSGPDQRSIAVERDRLKAELAERRAACGKLADDLKVISGMQRPGGSFRGWLGSPAYMARVLLASTRQGLRDLHAGLLAVLGWVVLGAGAYAAWHLAGQWVAAVSTAVAGLTPLAALAVARLRSGERAVTEFTSRRRSDLIARQREYEQEIQVLQDRLDTVDAAVRLERFIDQRGDDETYRQYRGLLGRVHDDLDQLSMKLRQARVQWAASGGHTAPPLERIVLYIDDLDRCPPRRVVEVLEAVHLMLALDLFVVVVAVDARWLIRSLEYHHRELFGRGDRGGKSRDAGEGNGGGRSGSADSQAGEHVATPINYLDKIFQIPFALQPPTPAAAAGYLRELLPKPTRTARPAPALSSAAREEPDDATGSIPATGPEATPTGHDPPGHRVEAMEPGGATAVELPPPALQVSPVEVEFMTRLGGLLPTPRAVKRLVNVYRLVRIGIRGLDLAGFVGDDEGGPFQAVQVLLAILVGHPEFAREMFLLILADASGQSGEEHYKDLAAVVERAGSMAGDVPSFRIIHSFLSQIKDEAPRAVSMAECRRWCPQLARYSFYTRELAGAYLDMPGVARFADVDLTRDTPTGLTHVTETADDAAHGAEAL